jgi:hypothetical protein
VKLKADFVELVSAIAPAVSHELSKAEALARRKFYTEAGLRLGRAVESALYCTARELSLEVSDRRIGEFTILSEQLWQKEAEIIRRKSPSEVEKLSEVAGVVARLIFRLAADPGARAGEPTVVPRRTDSLLREMLAALGNRDSADAIELQKHAPMMRRVQEMRNRAAHASNSGETRELEADDLNQLASDVSTVIRGLMHIIISAQAGARDPPVTT